MRGRSTFRATMEQYGLVPDRGVISILVVLGVIWLLFRLLGGALGPLLAHLVLFPARGIGPEPWQLLTNFFINLEGGQILMTAVTLLFFGNAVERTLGARGVWKTFIAGGIGGSIAAGLIGRLILPQAPILGSTGAATAMLTAFAACAGNYRVSLFGAGEMRPATMAWIWLGISVLFAVVQFIDGAPWQQLVISLFLFAGAAAAGWFVGGGRRRRGGIDLGGSLDKLRLWRLRRRYRVLSGGRDSRDTEKYLN
jgi:membrane associated rhomboid family serine protease